MKDFFGYKDEYLATQKGYNLMRFINPIPCMVCGDMEFIEHGPFCHECFEKFTDLLNSYCPVCGGDKNECLCTSVNGIKKMYFLFWYDKRWSADFVSKIKYEGDYRYVSYFGKLIADNIKENMGKMNFSGVCFVPRSRENFNKRGFDQARLMAESVAYHLQIPLLDCLKRFGKSDEQKKLSGYERRKNVKNKFFVDYKGLVNENGEIPSKVLLIDDVITTGATVRECAYLLRKSGVRSVFVGAIAKTSLKKYKKGRYKKKR